MSVAPGSRIGVYEVTSQLGEGGMGVVFRARDTKLLRDVALKVLPEHFADDPDRLQRLNREAQILASLNHTNIAQIYGLEQLGSAGCIVMELVEGETIADRLKNGPIPVDEAIAIAKQIADGLAAAHERGIVHRDLKPANIKLTPNGTVKILDFGLSKAVAQQDTKSNPSMMPTKMSGSVVGAIVGTAAYMSPEQARGKEVDGRTDIWAFGCVLYEMLTARQAFDGETITDMLAKIVTGQPDFNLLPAGISPSIRLLLEATLNKNVSQRLQHIGDMRLFLDPKFFPSAPETPAVAPARKSGSGTLLVAALVVLLIAALIPASLYFRRPTSPAPRLMRFELTPAGLTGPIIPSPDGQKIAYAAQGADGVLSTWIRSIGSDTAQKLSGGDNPNATMWSADSRYLGIFSDGKLKKIDPATGSIQTITDAAFGFRGADWNQDGVILASMPGETAGSYIIARVSDAGGKFAPLTALDSNRKETLHAVPVFLPDGKHFLFAIVSSVPENLGIYVASLDDPKSRNRVMPLPSTLNSLAYVDGFIFLNGGSTVTAQPFDPNKLTLSGQPIRVADGIESNSFEVSKSGLMMYRKASVTPTEKQLTWFDRTGKPQGKIGANANYGTVELSPNGDRAAVDIITNMNRDVWVVDIARGVPSRISYDPASDWSPSWSGDGTKIVFASTRSGNDDIYEKSSNGIGAEELVYKSDKVEIPVAWSRDGKYIAFSRTKTSGAGNDTWLLQLPDKKESPYVESQFDKIHARISPDGRWMAYATNDSGMYQIVVQSFPDPNGGKWQISSQGGVEPKWRRDGRELYYLAYDGKLMAVPIKTEPTFEAGAAVELFQTPLGVNRSRPDRDRRYDVAADGRFIMVLPIQSAASPVTVVVNWASGLETK